MRSKDESKLLRILQYVEGYIEECDEFPSLGEIAKDCGTSVTTAYRYVMELDKRGRLAYDGKTFSNDKIDKMLAKGTRVALVGSIACGMPSLEEENVEEYFSLPESLVGVGKFFLLRAYGNSMIKAGINKGDLVLVKQQNYAKDDDIVVALVGNENTLKRFYRDDKRKKIILHPENDDMEDIFVDECVIQGVAIKVLKDL